ncbi:photoreceptor outer segment membrane glycoprotein 2-like [Lingula anatina]|uniref:Photoreceptor outer segment membrane glycoprotein 2-like n=1 Tax=Lingula anatina TaxID=7574 RepID=A0A1S3K2C9_LINAN|nr:photoreceptor outer segment membrane glycoprotein 2-like [Lingula anatina]|eukprot:XP_013416793.1 photoreceptor outer segment membrane glycoprotein 2-like [Lingula anatina]
MAILAINFSADGRSKLGLALAILCWISIVPCLMLVGLGAYIKLKLADKMHLVDGYHGDSLPYMLISIGLLSAIVSGIGGLICNISSKADTRALFKSFLTPYVVILAVLCVCVLAAGIMCFTEISALHKSFHRGILLAMFKYRSNPGVKSKVDLLQMEYRCCGNTNYADWFQIPWINENFLKIEDKDDFYTNDDVPFSCCDHASRRPCIHHDVHDNSKHYNYDYRVKTTLNQHGCKRALMRFFGDQVLTNGGGITLGVFGLQLVILVLSRYLQSSVHNATEQGDPTAPALGWLIGDFGAEKPKDEKDDGAMLMEEEEKLDIDEEEVTEHVEIIEDVEEFEEPIYENIPHDEVIVLSDEDYKA